MDYSRSSSYSSRSSNAPSIQKSASSSSRSSRSSTPISYSSSSSSPALPLAGSSKSNSSVSSHGGGNLGNILSSHSPLRTYSAPDFQKGKKKTGPAPSPYIYGTHHRTNASPSQNLHKPDPSLPIPGKDDKPKPDAQLAGLLCSTDPDELKLAGNDYYRQGRFAESLQLYSRAVQVLPPNLGDAQLRANRAASLLALGRVGEAVAECEAAIKCDPEYKRARQRIAGLLTRLGRCADARNHLALLGNSYEKGAEERMRVMAVEEAILRMQQLVQAGEWDAATRQAEVVVRAGGDLVPQVRSYRIGSDTVRLVGGLLQFQRMHSGRSCACVVSEAEDRVWSSCLLSQSEIEGMMCRVACAGEHGCGRCCDDASRGLWSCRGSSLQRSGVLLGLGFQRHCTVGGS